ncbi:unnamed protein product [Calypogeia fissa]
MGLIGGDGGKKAHLLVIPMSHHGHLIPSFRLVTELARKGVTITCAIYDDLLAKFSSSGVLSELQSLNVQFIALHNPWGPTPDIPVIDSRNLQESFKPVLEKLLHDKSSGNAGPTCLLTDMFLTWAQELSEKLEIPYYMFIPSGAILARLKQENIRLMAQNVFKIAPDGPLVKYEGAVDMDGIPSLRHHELIVSARLYPAYFLIRCKVMCRAAGVVINTFYDLEDKVIESMTNPSPSIFEENKVGKVYPVGPLFSASPKARSIAVVKELKDSAEESISWLDAQPPASVLYVAFGTMTKLKAEYIYELAWGLEGSNQRFLWVLPQRKFSPEEKISSITDLLPEGFQARVGDRGRIVTGWAPQVQILAHSATGGFLTHAGWNSCLESITNGVPMIAWPQWAEQDLNCRYLVDMLKIADQIQTGPEKVLDRKEVERAVRVLMVEPEGKEMRRRVQELQRKGEEAVAEDGSMSRTIDELARDISASVSHHSNKA